MNDCIVFDADTTEKIGTLSMPVDTPIQRDQMIFLDQRCYGVSERVAYTVVRISPCFRSPLGHKPESFQLADSFIFVRRVDTKIDPGKAAPAHGDGFFHKYIIAKTDGTPIKNGAEYVVLNMVHDPHAQVALKVYCDAAEKTPRLALFSEELRLRLQAVRKRT